MSLRRHVLGGTTIAVAATVLGAAAPAVASSPPVSGARIVTHFDLSAGQQPENIALNPDGSANLTFAVAHQVAVVARTGQARVLATLPAPVNPATPVLGGAFLTGIVRAGDGTLFVGYATGTPDLNGVWRVTPGGRAERVSALPPTGLPNGMALDEQAGALYVADSVLGTVWRVPLRGGSPVAWATGAALLPTGFLGANGIKVHDHAVWVTNTDRGTVVRIPIRPDGSAGPTATRVSGLAGPDDLAFAGRDDTMLVALNTQSEVALVAPDGTQSIVLTAQDGLSNPTSIGVHGSTVYVASAAYFTLNDPNLLVARLARPHRR